MWLRSVNEEIKLGHFFCCFEADQTHDVVENDPELRGLPASIM